MGVSVERESPEVIRVKLSGRVNWKEWRSALEKVATHLNPEKTASIFVAAERFDGWDSGDWGDLSFQEKYDPQINRMAIVVAREWQDRALQFAGKGFRKIQLECFLPEEVDRARQWLTS